MRDAVKSLMNLFPSIGSSACRAGGRLPPGHPISSVFNVDTERGARPRVWSIGARNEDTCKPCSPEWYSRCL